MDQLDQVLSAVRREYEPDDEAQARVRALVAAGLPALGAAHVDPSALAGAPAGSGQLAAGSSWFGASALKGTLAAVAVGGAAFAVAASGGPGTPRDSAQATQVPISARVVAQAQEVHPEAPAALAVEAATPPTSPAEPSRASEKALVHSGAAPKATDLDGARGVTMEELKLLSEASQALRADRLADAERALALHRSRYPSSAMARERQGLSLLIRCAGGVSVQTQAAAERFVSSAAATPIADSVRKKCLR